MPNESLNPLPNVPAVIKVMGGPMGPPGPPNAGVFIKGIANQWPPVADKNAVVGDLYVIPDPVPPLAPGWALPGHGAFWDGKQWLDAGLLRGTKGERGEPGPPLNVKGVAIGWVPSANPQPGDIWQLPEILPAGVPSEFKAGGAAAWDSVDKKWIPLDAVRGPAGHDVEVFGPSATPPTTGAEKGDIWLSTDCTLFSDTFDPSTITQVPGPEGPQGKTGPSAYEVWKLSVGRPTAPMDDFLAAITGAKGDKGDKGEAGETFKVEGVVATVADLPATPPRLTVYMVQADGSLHIYDPASAAKETNDYVNLGKIAGPAGVAAWLSTPVADETKLPATGSAGEMVYVALTGHLWGWDDVNAKWVDGGKIGGGIDDGATQGQILVWDDGNKKWSPTDSPLPAAAHGGEVVTWDSTSTTWVARQPLLSELQDVDDNSTNLFSSCVLVWDPDVNQWTDSRSIQIDDIEFDASGPGTLMEGIAAYSDAGLDPTKDTWVPSCMAVAKYIKEGVALEDLGDCSQLAFAADGQVPVWNDTNGRWEPKDPAGTSPIIYLGNGAWDPTKVNDPAQNYGMGMDTVPDPADYAPMPGDQYIDLATGSVTAFIGSGSPVSPVPGRTISTITGGSSPVDNVPNGLNDLVDVSVASPQDGQMLVYSSASSKWENVAAPAATSASSPGDLWMVGDLKQSILLETAFINELPAAERGKWVLADGRTVTGSRYATITGNSNVPDLRGAFLRMSGNNAASGRTHWAGGGVGDFGEDGTAMPKNHPFTATAAMAGNHSHRFTDPRRPAKGGGFSSSTHDGYPETCRYPLDNSGTTSTDGNHSHGITVAGGDNETRPKHYCLNFYIKVN